LPRGFVGFFLGFRIVIFMVISSHQSLAPISAPPEPLSLFG
jgi:hypothetical protein